MNRRTTKINTLSTTTPFEPWVVSKEKEKKVKTKNKVDTNLSIKLDVDAPEAASEYLERGYDEEKKMKYYKVYFNEEK